MTFIGIGIGLNQMRSGAGSVDADAAAYFAAMSVQPDATRKGHLTTLITALKSGGVWAKLDWLTIHAAHDEQAARVNAKNPAQVATAPVAPTFTLDRGHTGNGTTQYLDTGYNTSTAGGLFTQNNCHMGVWIGNNITGTAYDIGHSNAAINSRNASVSNMSVQSAANSVITNSAATSIGHTSWTRDGATTGASYKNGVAGTTITSTSTALRNASFLLLAVNSSSTGTVTPGSFCTRRIQASHWGAGLTAGETLALYNALAAYMTAVGA